MLQKQTDALDSVDTTGDKEDGVFSHIAFATVLSSDNKVRRRVPIPILDDQPVVLAVNISNDAGSALAFQKNALERDVANAWQEQNELFREITKRLPKPPIELSSRKKSRRKNNASRAKWTVLPLSRRRVKPVQGTARFGPIGPAAERTNRLTNFLAKLKKIDAEENDPQKKKWLANLTQGQQLEAMGVRQSGHALRGNAQGRCPERSAEVSFGDTPRGPA